MFPWLLSSSVDMWGLQGWAPRAGCQNYTHVDTHTHTHIHSQKYNSQQSNSFSCKTKFMFLCSILAKLHAGKQAD